MHKEAQTFCAVHKQILLTIEIKKSLHFNIIVRGDNASDLACQ